MYAQDVSPHQRRSRPAVIVRQKVAAPFPGGWPGRLVGLLLVLSLGLMPRAGAAADPDPAAVAPTACQDDPCLLQDAGDAALQPALIRADRPSGPEASPAVAAIASEPGQPLAGSSPQPSAQPVVRIVADAAEADRDGDGVADALDVCQATAPSEPVNGFGCRAAAPLLATVRFALAEASLSDRARRQLEPVAATLRQYADMQVALAGYTDATGSESTNLALARRRAASVAQHLMRLGVSSARLVPSPYGERSPVADNADALGRAENRRVEIRILAAMPYRQGSTGMLRHDAPTDVRSGAAGTTNE